MVAGHFVPISKSFQSPFRGRVLWGKEWRRSRESESRATSTLSTFNIYLGDGELLFLGGSRF